MNPEIFLFSTANALHVLKRIFGFIVRLVDLKDRPSDIMAPVDLITAAYAATVAAGGIMGYAKRGKFSIIIIALSHRNTNAMYLRVARDPATYTIPWD